MHTLPFSIPSSKHKLALSESVLSMGSCFAVNIGKHLEQHKFKTLSNPFGTIFNPISLFKALSLSAGKKFDIDRCLINGEVHAHWDFHSDVSALNAEALKHQITKRLQLAHSFISKADHLILTFGTAYAYKLKSSGEIVTNCHKVPQSNFDKILLNSPDIVAEYINTMDSLRTINPAIKVILTVSPVRHMKDGLIQNNLSKAQLISAAHEICVKDRLATYFPAYEIMIDELRDYRYYTVDMLHPSNQAIEYIWEKFTKTHMNDSTQSFVVQWKQILSSLNHRPLHPESAAHQSFLLKLKEGINSYSSQVDVRKEISFINQQIQN
jgi:hypothetical protein